MLFVIPFAVTDRLVKLILMHVGHYLVISNDNKGKTP